MNNTLTDLIARVRERSDTEFDDHVTDSEITKYINASAQELYELIISAFSEHYFINEQTINLVAGTYEYSLASDFFKLKGVDYQLNNNQYAAMDRFQFRERNNNSQYPYGPIKYSLWGTSKIKFLPQEQVRNGIVKIYYIPVYPGLVNGTDVLQGFNGWEEYVVIDAAIKIKVKKDLNSKDLRNDKIAMLNRINKAKEDRDSGTSTRISDVDGDPTRFWP